MLPLHAQGAVSATPKSGGTSSECRNCRHPLCRRGGDWCRCRCDNSDNSTSDHGKAEHHETVVRRATASGSGRGPRAIVNGDGPTTRTASPPVSTAKTERVSVPKATAVGLIPAACVGAGPMANRSARIPPRRKVPARSLPICQKRVRPDRPRRCRSRQGRFRGRRPASRDPFPAAVTPRPKARATCFASTCRKCTSCVAASPAERSKTLMRHDQGPTMASAKPRMLCPCNRRADNSFPRTGSTTANPPPTASATTSRFRVRRKTMFRGGKGRSTVRLTLGFVSLSVKSVSLRDVRERDHAAVVIARTLTGSGLTPRRPTTCGDSPCGSTTSKALPVWSATRRRFPVGSATTSASPWPSSASADDLPGLRVDDRRTAGAPIGDVQRGPVVRETHTATGSRNGALVPSRCELPRRDCWPTE